VIKPELDLIIQFIKFIQKIAVDKQAFWSKDIRQ